MMPKLNTSISLLIQTFLKNNPQLRHKKYKSNHHPLAGHCYIAAEAYYYSLPLNERASYVPCCLSLGELGSHWFLKHRVSGKVIDLTGDQFLQPVDHSRGVNKGFLTSKPSKRAQIILDFLEKSTCENI